ncbi:uncharacterized protein F4822DRAFT_58993 [Hypoxylon trugodes]|uniref:uncharacterized protein n=1 Tax=Hypoxylon trugodes TaxID=326681 RepID=UPI002194E4D3|nr:uncharacterized protein F4822DRAFT_58993 [Hypoxylon trugodes]KAI1384034.1 hypothetical protein F4822DRAFT_58993 [Hypoxylon trugodes]
MEVEIGPSSPAAITLSGFPQANPRAVHLPAVAPAAIGVPVASTRTHNFDYPSSYSNSYPNPNSYSSHSRPDACYSNSEILQQQGRNLDVGGGTRKMRKRKAESQDNERLSKRLSLLNLEQNGQKLYVPVESPKLRPTESASLTQIPEDDTMQLDDSKHKVYIYNLDDELTDSESDSDTSGRLVFLPDIEKHLMQTRIPPSILANKDGEIAGMQMVLYSEPSSLTVPQEKDSVRKAIIESRQRVREKQKEEREQQHQQATSGSASSNSATPASSTSQTVTAPPVFPASNNGPNTMNGFAHHNGAAVGTTTTNYNYDDPDAMEVD